MPDTTRTNRGSVTDDLARELVQIARAGLAPLVLAQRHHEFLTAFGLSRVKDAGTDPEAMAGELIQLIVEGARLVEGKGLSAMTLALFGVEIRYRDLSYERRRGMARAIWDQEEVRRDDSWTRRILPKITSALAATLLRINSSWETGAEAASSPFALGTGSLRDQKHSSGLDRISFRA